MKIKLVLGLIMMALFTGISQASSDALSSSSVMEWCEMPDNPNRSACNAYMIGFTWGVFAGVSLKVPKNGVKLSALTLTNMFIKYMREHPEAGDINIEESLEYLLIKSGKFVKA